jgi:hypothetical protein
MRFADKQQNGGGDGRPQSQSTHRLACGACSSNATSATQNAGSLLLLLLEAAAAACCGCAAVCSPTRPLMSGSRKGRMHPATSSVLLASQTSWSQQRRLASKLKPACSQ